MQKSQDGVVCNCLYMCMLALCSFLDDWSGFTNQKYLPAGVQAVHGLPGESA